MKKRHRTQLQVLFGKAQNYLLDTPEACDVWVKLKWEDLVGLIDLLEKQGKKK